MPGPHRSGPILPRGGSHISASPHPGGKAGGQGLGNWKVSKRISKERISAIGGKQTGFPRAYSFLHNLPRNPVGSWGASWAVGLAWGVCVFVHSRAEKGAQGELLSPDTYPPPPAEQAPDKWRDAGSSAGGRQRGQGLWAPGEPGREGSGEGRGMEIHKEDLLGRSDAQRRLMKQIPRWVSEQLPKSLFAFKFPQGGGCLV